jgi:hypothetical protein
MSGNTGKPRKMGGKGPEIAENGGKQVVNMFENRG